MAFWNARSMDAPAISVLPMVAMVDLLAMAMLSFSAVWVSTV